MSYRFPSCPPANEMAEMMLLHVFHLHGFPRDVVSDQGPQFGPSELLLEPLSASPLVTIPGAMGKLKDWTKTWRWVFAVLPPAAPPRGVRIWSRSNMLTMALPLVLLLISVLMGNLFADLETEVAVSAQALICQCHRICNKTRSHLNPYSISKVLNEIAVHLKKIPPTFHTFMSKTYFFSFLKTLASLVYRPWYFHSIKGAVSKSNSKHNSRAAKKFLVDWNPKISTKYRLIGGSWGCILLRDNV